MLELFQSQTGSIRREKFPSLPNFEKRFNPKLVRLEVSSVPSPPFCCSTFQSQTGSIRSLN